jgi:hypothetical protein
MEFSPDDLISPNEIKADVLVSVNDEDEKKFTSGWYTSQIQQALEEMSFDSYFMKRFEDFNIDDTLKLKVPKGAFNVREVFLWNGDECVIEDMVNVYVKRNYYNTGADKGYTARNRTNTSDPFVSGISDESELYYCSLQNGYIHLSQTATGFSHARVYFNGVLHDIGETPFVPRQFRQVVKLWVEYQFYKAMTAKNPRTYNTLKQDAYNTLYRPFTGEWDKAISRAKNIDTKWRKDMVEYMSRGNW